MAGTYNNCSGNNSIALEVNLNTWNESEVEGYALSVETEKT